MSCPKIYDYLQLMTIYSNYYNIYKFLFQMRIVKVQIEKLSGKSIILVKHAISLNYKQHSKIKDFINYIKKICKLHDVDYVLQIDGYILANNDKTKALQEKHVYRLKLANKRTARKGLEIQQYQENEEDNNYEEQQILQRKRIKKPKEAILPMRIGLNIPKTIQKKSKILRKRDKIIDSSSSQSSSSQSSSSSSSDSQSSEDFLSQQSKEIVRVNPTKKIYKNIIQQKKKQKIIKANKKKISISSSSSSEKLPTLNINQHPKEVEVILPKQQKHFIKNKNQQKMIQKERNIKKQTKKPLEQNNKEHDIQAQRKEQNNQVHKNDQSVSLKKNVDKIDETKNKKNTTNVLKKKVISDSSSSQSDPTPQIKRKEKSSTITIAKEIPKPLNPPTGQLKLLPSALRNKIYQKKFQEHKENQWLIVDKQKLKLWKQKGNNEFCQINNRIRYKIIEFNEQKFIPVKSDWIYAQVKEISHEGKIILQKVEQNGKFKNSAQIFQFNMDELQIFKPLATQQQISCLNGYQIKVEKGQQQKQKGQKNGNQQRNENTINNQSIEKFICGQANYYFSDKNYNFDLFMQMHANLNPQKYLNLRVLLNFPKIKKFLRDEDKLIEYLQSDDRYDQRNYQIDYQRRLIRKKGAYKPPQPQNNQIQEVKQQIEAGQLKQQKQVCNQKVIAQYGTFE